MRSWCCLGLLPAILLLTSLNAGAAKITSIRVENRGAGTVHAQSVLAHVALEEGEAFDRSAISRDIKTLQKTGRFSYVSAEFQEEDGGVIVTFVVKSKLKIRHLTIEGADEVGNKRVRDWLDLGFGDFVGEATMEVAVRKVLEEYKNRYFHKAHVTWELKENFVNGTANVLLVVKEGRRARVRKVMIEGNYDIKDRTLRKVMTQKKWKLLSVFTKSGIYKPDELRDDMLAVRALYLNKGYLDVRLEKPEVVEAKPGRLDITIRVREGQVYRVSEVTLEGVEAFSKEDVERTLTLKPGATASMQAIDRSAQAARDYYGSRGYIRTRVKPDLDADVKKAEVAVHYKLREGNLAYIRDIHIRGNTRTKDKVIRRELVVYPGDIFNEVKVKRSERRVKNLAFFKTVKSTPLQTSDPDQYDIVFEVEEQKTGQFIIGFGFSSIDDLIGFAELSQGNFDITAPPGFTGGGQKLKLRVQLGTEQRDLELTFVEPWFLDRRLSLQLDLFQNDRRFLSDEYDQRNTGGRIGLGKALPFRLRANVRYSFQNIEVRNVDDDASDLIKAEEGERTRSAVRFQLSRDTRNNFFVATRGNRTVVSVEVAGGPFGGETDIYVLEARTSQHIPLWFGHVFNVRARVTTVEEHGDSEEVPIFDRLFMGGSRTLRGFAFRDVGPKDEQGEPIGGKSAWYTTLEYTVPLASILRVAGFYDVGMAYEEPFDFGGDLNSDAGVGVRLDMPGFPLRLDFAWPLETDEFNDRSGARFNILLGHVF